MKNSPFFTPFTLGQHTLKNRRAATIARTAYDSRSVIS